MARCFYCDHELIWGSDIDVDEYNGNQETGVASFYTCPECGAEYIVYQPDNNE